MSFKSTFLNPQSTQNKRNLSTLFPLMWFLSINLKLNLAKTAKETPQKVTKESLKIGNNIKPWKTHETRASPEAGHRLALPSCTCNYPVTVACPASAYCGMPYFFLFCPFCLLFKVLSWLSLLPTKANKTTKNPEDYIIKRAKTK